MALNRPPWLAAAAFAALATALICWPAWPGYMSYDSLLAWDQANYGVQTALWPPLHTYLFELSRAAHLGTGGLFAAQTFVLLFGAVLTLRIAVPSRALGWTLALFFLGGLAFFPTLLGTMLAHWRDGPTGGFAILGVALWLAAVQARSPLLLIPAVLAVGVSVGLRYNALFLVAPLLVLMAWRPFLEGRAHNALRALVVLTIALSLGLAWASTQWRLPDGVKLPNPGGLGGAQLFDVIGVSACSGHNYLPGELTDGRPITVSQLRQAYDPRHLHYTLEPRPGAPRIYESDAGGKVGQAWRRLLLAEPGCYLAHRGAVFAEQMGMKKDGLYYAVHDGIDANAFDLKLAHPKASNAVRDYVKGAAGEPWRRPWLLYAGAVVLALGAGLRDRRLGWLLAALVAGAFAYPALLFVAAPAADARYIFPSNVVCLLVALLSLGVLASPGRSR